VRSPSLEPSQAVEQIWSRGAEWGQNLFLIATTALAFVVMIYGLLSVEQYSLAFLVLLCAGLTLALLSYPILITLERPVRITPEQAVTDFYAALSHHVPHHRRMWLLLSTAGRVCGSFASFEGFKNYWASRIAAMKQGRASRMTPLKFQVSEFRSEKSAGKSQVDASYTVSCYIRGRQAEGAIETVKVNTSLVKGPDQMWYIDRGRLP
jgi:hypothetical protein